MNHPTKYMRHKLFTLTLAVCWFLGGLMADPSQSRDLSGRLGVGYNREFSNYQVTPVFSAAPGISIKYGLSRDFHANLILGVATSTPGNSVAAIKFSQVIFMETNMNFYGFLAGGIVSAASRSGAEFLGGMGAEIFIPGLESVGLSFDVGASLTNLSGSFILKTLGASFLDAGVHFYF